MMDAPIGGCAPQNRPAASAPSKRPGGSQDARRARLHGSGPPAEILTVNSVSKRFGGLNAVDEVTFSVDGGSITSVIGPNGAGKTTLFNLVSGVMRPSGGTITFRGREITGWSASRIARAGLSRTFQNARLFPNLNVLENVMVACRDGSANSHASRFRSREGQRARAEAVLERVGLTGRQCVAWPGELSYANQRRVEVARAIAPDPAFLMLDEPSAGMTHREAEEFFEIVRTLRAEQMTVLLIEHNVRLVMSASDKIVVVNFGKKIAEGPPEVVRDDPVVLEAYLGED